MTREFLATKKDIEALDEAFVESVAAQGKCFHCRKPTIRLVKKNHATLIEASENRDTRNRYGACVNPDCFMQTDINALTTWIVD